MAIIRRLRDKGGPHPRWIVADNSESVENYVLLGIAADEARLRNAPLKAITCGQTAGTEIDEGTAAADADRQARANSDRQLARWTRRYPDLKAESVAARGSLLDYLAENSQSVQLVVVGAPNHANVEQLVGPVGNRVLRNTECSVLIVNRVP